MTVLQKSGRAFSTTPCFRCSETAQSLSEAEVSAIDRSCARDTTAAAATTNGASLALREAIATRTSYPSVWLNQARTLVQKRVAENKSEKGCELEPSRFLLYSSCFDAKVRCKPNNVLVNNRNGLTVETIYPTMSNF